MVSVSQVLVVVVTALAIAAAQGARVPVPSGAKDWEVTTYDCGKFTNVNWDEAKYACTWRHNHDYGAFSNNFIKRYNGFLESDCAWKRGLLSSYGGKWGSRWTPSNDNEITCYTHDDK